MISCRKPRLRAVKRFFQQPQTILVPNCQATRTTYLGFRSPIYRHDKQQRRSLASLSYSYAEGPTEPPLVSSTLSSYFTNEIINRHSTRPALISRSEKPRIHGGPISLSKKLGVDRHLAWNFEGFDRHIEALAKGLVGLGVRKGDRVGVVMGNNSAYAMLQWACARIGAILVTLNPAYRLPELVKTLNLVEVSHLFIVPTLRSSNYIKTLTEAFPSLLSAHPGEIQEEALPSLRHVVVVDNTDHFKEFESLIDGVHSVVDFREVLVWREGGYEAKQVQEMERGLKEHDIINLQYTSGTTGAPKAVSLTHHNLLNNGILIGRCMRLTPSDILWNLAAWSHGSCIVYPSQSFDPKAIVDAVTQERCTALHGVPTHFLGVLAEVEKRREEGLMVDFSQLRTGIAAGSPIPIDLMKQLISKLNLTELTNAYGMTETSPVSFQTTPDDGITKRVETVGKIHPHVKAKLVNPQGDVVPVGTPGELLVSGYLVQKGYWEDESQTRKAMKEDEEGTLWMHTGDEGIMDDQGYLRIVGRMKDIIIRGGENLFPVQIENVLTEHHGIREAAAVSVPDPRFGEVVGAWVILEPHTELSREEVRKQVSENMNPQNAPSWVWFLGEEGVASELPKTASGKVQKHILRAWSKELAERQFGAVNK